MSIADPKIVNEPANPRPFASLTIKTQAQGPFLSTCRGSGDTAGKRLLTSNELQRDTHKTLFFRRFLTDFYTRLYMDPRVSSTRERPPDRLGTSRSFQQGQAAR